MKIFKYGLFIICFHTALNLSAQNNSKYKRALNYIANDNRGKKMAVSDTILNLNFESFGDRIAILYKRNKDSVYHELDSLDHDRRSGRYIIKDLENIKFNGSEPGYIIFFSPFYKDVVIGEIMVQKFKKRPFDYNAQAYFNESIRYLFIFDKKGRVKKVFKEKMHYD